MLHQRHIAQWIAIGDRLSDKREILPGRSRFEAAFQAQRRYRALACPELAPARQEVVQQAVRPLARPLDRPKQCLDRLEPCDAVAGAREARLSLLQGLAVLLSGRQSFEEIGAQLSGRARIGTGLIDPEYLQDLQQLERRHRSRRDAAAERQSQDRLESRDMDPHGRRGVAQLRYGHA